MTASSSRVSRAGHKARTGWPAPIHPPPPPPPPPPHKKSHVHSQKVTATYFPNPSSSKPKSSLFRLTVVTAAGLRSVAVTLNPGPPCLSIMQLNTPHPAPTSTADDTV